MGCVRRVEATQHQDHVHLRGDVAGHFTTSLGVRFHLARRQLLGVLGGHQVDPHLFPLQLRVELGLGSLVLGTKHLVHRVLAFLRGIADGVEGQEVFIDVLRTVLLDECPLKKLANELRLTLQHGGLVGHPQARQIHVGIEAVAHGLGKFGEELLLVPIAQHVVRHVLRFTHILQHQVLLCKGFGRNRLLVVVLAVDDGGMPLVLALLHACPDLGDPGTGGVHDLHVLLLEERHLVHRGAEGRQDHHVALLHSGVVLATIRSGLHKLHALVGQLLVH
mmetsp:Transcript_20448/g.34069  ORF Transcript_20448/g.34069 Transcript_20448/m.34069 type:complete len:277 (-) Transcript_20448:324-1154(-)